jgi:acetyl-CoA carboxylase biotin carboxyl carrier protein
MNLKEIKEMINLMNENDLTEIEVEREGTKIKIKKTSDEHPPVVTHSYPSYHVDSKSSSQASETPKDAGDASTISSTQQEIRSPMVGTFYRAPSPEAPSFVEVGDIVEVGQVVCIVEAMKLMNEIKSEVKGRITEIPVENAQPVEFGQVLFSVEPV